MSSGWPKRAPSDVSDDDEDVVVVLVVVVVMMIMMVVAMAIIGAKGVTVTPEMAFAPIKAMARTSCRACC